LAPHLIMVHIIDQPSTECHVEIDERDGRLQIPGVGEALTAEIGWRTGGDRISFAGFINDVEHGFGRKQGGRRMWLHATGYNEASHYKTPFQNAWGKGAPPGQEEGETMNFSKVFSEAAGMAGQGVGKIAQRIGNYKRDYWHMGNESFFHFGHRMAEELGGTFGIENGKARMIDPTVSEGKVIAQWQVNLIAYRVRPYVARTNWESVHQEFYSHIAGQWKSFMSKLGQQAPWGKALSQYQLPAPAPNANVAQQQAEGAGVSAKAASTGDGRVLINGEPGAKYAMDCVIKGVRPGVDGPYYIKKAEHIYSRQGYLTWCDVFTNLGSGGGGGGDS
jgi:hypothetical protein